MSLESLIKNAEAEKILSEKRLNFLISKEEKAGQILAALYLLKNTTDSIEPFIFLSVQNSFDHILNILNNIENGSNIKDSIQVELKDILENSNVFDKKSQFLRKTNFNENNENNEDLMLLKLEEIINRRDQERKTLSEELREIGLYEQLESIKEEIKNQSFQSFSTKEDSSLLMHIRDDIREDVKNEVRKELRSELKNLSLFENSSKSPNKDQELLEIGKEIIYKVEQKIDEKLIDLKEYMKPHFKQFSDDTKDIVKFLRKLFDMFETMKGEFLDKIIYFVKSYLDRFASKLTNDGLKTAIKIEEHNSSFSTKKEKLSEDLILVEELTKIIEKSFQFYYNKLKPYFKHLESKIEKYAVKEGVKVIDEIKKESLPGFLTGKKSKQSSFSSSSENFPQQVLQSTKRTVLQPIGENEEIIQTVTTYKNVEEENCIIM